MAAIIVNPICPFTLSHRPLVFPGQETIAVRVDREQRSDVLLTIDGQVTRRLLEGDEVLVCGAPFKAALIAADRNSFYTALQTKLPWSGGAANA
jgi:NAD+ kinase